MAMSRGKGQRFVRGVRGCPGISWAQLLIPAMAVTIAVGCAAPSEPVTRHPPIPNPVIDLEVHQLGGRMFLSFTLPTKTTDRKPIGSTPSLEIFWTFLPADAALPLAAAVEKPNGLIRVPSAMVSQYASEGRVRFPVELRPEDITHNFGWQAAYVIHTSISEKKSSDPSNVAVTRVYPSAPPISDLSAKVTKEALELNWSPVTPPVPRTPAGAGASVSYRVYRVENHETKNPQSESGFNPSLSEVLGDTPAQSFRDTSFEFGHTYTYSARSIVHYGSSPAESVESDDSNLLKLTPKDIFPPAAPKGLVAVVVPATSEIPAHIELSWAISPETDLAGYNVYRNEQGSAPVPRLNVSTLLVPSYRDMSVMPGRLYTYTVKAVDRAGNESPASEPVTAGISAAEKDSNP